MEAHAQDVWPLGQHVCVQSHKTINDRIEVAKQFISKTRFELPMVVDSMDNNFLFTYLAHPERFYAFFQHRLQFKAQPVYALYPYDLSTSPHHPLPSKPFLPRHNINANQHETAP
eukprot:TRINITY_DN3848_c0_g1_i1.p2 TRINITY_DN3848_c0_g1~~TRINITY_DN3848_c0_g1_i1.p2  ORF type:complete len:115 (-),score=21.45 TRINITY_DN3848_c0_g1_i1:134-478(-)